MKKPFFFKMLFVLNVLAIHQTVMANDQFACMNTREVESIYFKENPSKLIKANFDSSYTIKQLDKSYTTLEISPSIIQAKNGYDALNQVLNGIETLSSPTCERNQDSIISTYTFNISGVSHTLRVTQLMDQPATADTDTSTASKPPATLS